MEPITDSLYATAGCRQTVAHICDLVRPIWQQLHASGHTAAVRLAERPFKKLVDEISPALIYAQQELPGGEIQFHLSQEWQGEDATVWPYSSSPGIPVEVTVASGTLRHHEMMALNQIGHAHSIIGVSNKAKRATIRKRYAAERIAHERPAIIEHVATDVRLAVPAEA